MIKKNKSGAPTKGLKDNNQQQQPQQRQLKKLSEYGKQLHEKQRVKRMYGLREKQFRNCFNVAKHSEDATGAALLVLLERRLDNVVHRMKIAITRLQSRQMVVHGHIFVNGKRVNSPSFLVKVGDVVTLSEKTQKQETFMQAIHKSLAVGAKIPEWIESEKGSLKGKVLRLPVREDLQATINENYIVELYSR